MSEKPLFGGLAVCRPEPLAYPKPNHEFGVRLMSDLHIGGRNVDYALMKEELEEAGDNGWRVNLNGDVFDGIVAKDKRFVPDTPHPRIARRGSDLIGEAVRWGLELIGPYAHLVDVVGTGNHERAVLKYGGVDMTKLLVDGLRELAPKKHRVHNGGYSGFIDYRMRATWPGSKESFRYVIYYHHGSGGSGAPVTRGMIDLYRRCYARADMIWLGHKHNRTFSQVETFACPEHGEAVKHSKRMELMTGSYFRTYEGQSQESIDEHGEATNYAAEQGFAPQGRGGAVLFMRPTRGGLKTYVKM